jgi:hypothetical protein
VHHWIVGTPFQYIAFGLTASDPASRESRRLFTFGLLLLLLFRVPGLVAMESAVREGRFGPEWHPDLTKVGTWASEKGDDTVFVVADWGIGTQIACFSSGRHKPTELFWDYHRREQFSEAISSSKTRVYYLLALREPSPVNPEATRRLTDDAPTMDGWQEQQVDPEAGALTTLIIRRFVRRSISP